MTRALVLTGGPDHAHDFPSSGAALAELVAAAGFTTAVVDHPDDAAARLEAGGVSVLVVNALRWRMLGERYDAWREQWGYETSELVRRALPAFVAAGGGLVGSHTASICFDDWPAWGEVLGGAWVWDHSSHPPLGPAEVRVVSSHPVVEGLPPSFTVVDEVYGDQRLQPGIEVLAVSRRTPDDHDQPVAWAHTHGAGRVAYVGFGHDDQSLRQPELARLLRQAVRWAAREDG